MTKLLGMPLAIHRILFSVTLLSAVWVACLRPCHAQDQNRGDELSADETLKYLQQKLDTYGVASWYAGLECSGSQQTLEISSDRRFVIYTVTEDWTSGSRKNKCLHSSYQIPVAELRTGSIGRYPNPEAAHGGFQRGALTTGDSYRWRLQAVTSIVFACKDRECVKCKSDLGGKDHWESAGMDFYNAPEEQIDRISRATAHLIEALKKEPANIQQDKNDPFAR